MATGGASRGRMRVADLKIATAGTQAADLPAAQQMSVAKTAGQGAAAGRVRAELFLA